MMTLVEYAKTAANRGETLRASVIALFARSSAWLAMLPFMDIQGNAYAYNTEGALPGVAFRGVNESFTRSTGIINPQAEALRIAGGDLAVDAFLLRTMGPGRRAIETEMKIKALAAEITRVLIKGDSTSNPREFDGLQNRITGDQIIDAGNTDGGDALSLAKLDELIDAVPGCNALWMNKAMRRRIAQAARDPSVGGYVTWDPDEFGRPVARYNGIPMVVPYPENDGTEPLAFDEAGSGGSTATATSIYALRIGPVGVQGIQSAPMQVRDLGEETDAPQVVTRVEWDISLLVEHGRAAARLRGIKNVAVTK